MTTNQYCNCNPPQPVVCRQVKTQGQNFGKYYIACVVGKVDQGGCGLFKFVPPPANAPPTTPFAPFTISTAPPPVSMYQQPQSSNPVTTAPPTQSTTKATNVVDFGNQDHTNALAAIESRLGQTYLLAELAALLRKQNGVIDELTSKVDRLATVIQVQEDRLSTANQMEQQ